MFSFGATGEGCLFDLSQIIKSTLLELTVRPFGPSRMGPLDQIYHLANFLAPAFAVAIALAFAGHFFINNSALAHGFIAQAAINFIAGVLTLGLGLWFFGRDGKMASYAALLVVATTSQWVGGRSWR
jgi:hypothetical protein